MASVYRIRKEETASGVRYLVDYRDSTGRRTKRRFKKARDAEAFKKQVDMSTYTGLPLPRPVSITFAVWAKEWLTPKEALRLPPLEQRQTFPCLPPQVLTAGRSRSSAWGGSGTPQQFCKPRAELAKKTCIAIARTAHGLAVCPWQFCCLA